MHTCKRCGGVLEKKNLQYCSTKCSNKAAASIRSQQRKETLCKSLMNDDWVDVLRFSPDINVDNVASKQIHDILDNDISLRSKLFFVYVDRKQETDEAFYVGKGINCRINCFIRNTHHSNVTAKHEHNRTVVHATLDEAEAFDIETKLIAELRTFDCGANMTLGGEGARGSIRPLKARQQAMKQVCQYTLAGKLVETFESVKAAKASTGLTMNGCLSGARTSCGGFIWKYVDGFAYAPKSEETIMNMKAAGRKECRDVVQLTLSGEVLAEYKGAKHAFEVTGIGKDNIARCCYSSFVKSTAGGYRAWFVNR